MQLYQQLKLIDTVEKLNKLSYEELIDAAKPIVTHIIKTLCPKAYDQESTTQILNLAVLDARNKYNPGFNKIKKIKFSGWCYFVVRSRMKDILEKHNTHKHKAFDNMLSLDADIGVEGSKLQVKDILKDSKPSPVDELIAKENKKELKVIIERYCKSPNINSKTLPYLLDKLIYDMPRSYLREKYGSRMNGIRTDNILKSFQVYIKARLERYARK